MTAEVHCEVTSADELVLVEGLHHDSRAVAMAGDGINGAPALAKADVGIGRGVRTDVPRSNAQATLVTGDPARHRARAADAAAAVAHMKQNLALAFVCNALGVPMAAGLFYPFAGWLPPPMFAALAMSVSSTSWSPMRCAAEPLGTTGQHGVHPRNEPMELRHVVAEEFSR